MQTIQYYLIVSSAKTRFLTFLLNLINHTGGNYATYRNVKILEFRAIHKYFSLITPLADAHITTNYSLLIQFFSL